MLSVDIFCELIETEYKLDVDKSEADHFSKLYHITNLQKVSDSVSRHIL